MFYCDWQETFLALPNEKAGELIKHLLAYVNDENPKTNDLLITAVFANIKQTLKRDLKKWEARSDQNRINANMRWHPNVSDGVRSDTNDADTDTDTDTVIDNDKVNNKNKRFNFRKELIGFAFEEKLIDEWIKVRKTKKLTNTQTSLTKFLNECNKATTVNMDGNDILKMCVENSWGGFKASWIKDKNKNLSPMETLLEATNNGK